jgi:hypothetical protein
MMMLHAYIITPLHCMQKWVSPRANNPDAERGLGTRFSAETVTDAHIRRERKPLI